MSEKTAAEWRSDPDLTCYDTVKQIACIERILAQGRREGYDERYNTGFVAGVQRERKQNGASE